MDEPICLLIFLVVCSPLCLSKEDYSYQKQSEKTRFTEKRIVLHSSTDVLQVISNLTGQVASLTGEVASLKKDHSKEIEVIKRNLISMQHDNTNLKTLIRTLEANNSNLQTMVNAMQGGTSKDQSLIRMLQNNISNFHTVVQTLELETAGASPGSTYVRWGRKSCAGNGTKTVYSGFAAGGHYSHSGSATNHLCLVPDPVWGHYSDSEDSNGKIYGAEYQFSDSKSQVFFGGDRFHDEDTPCSVCRSPRPTVIMLPGRNVCYTGWSLEYSGYLASGDRVDPSGTEYLCLDDNPEVIVGGHNNNDENVLYFVEGICGSLKCPPYVNNRELTCVVCSK